MLCEDQSELQDSDQSEVEELGNYICIKSDQLGTWVGGNFVRGGLPFGSTHFCFLLEDSIVCGLQELLHVMWVSPLLFEFQA